MRVGQAKNKSACCIDMHCGYIFVYSNPDEGHVAATLWENWSIRQPVYLLHFWCEPCCNEEDTASWIPISRKRREKQWREHLCSANIRQWTYIVIQRHTKETPVKTKCCVLGFWSKEQATNLPYVYCQLYGNYYDTTVSPKMLGQCAKCK